MSRPQAPLDPKRTETLSDYGRFASLGIQFVVAMCFFGWVGWWIDGKLGTYPLLLIIGLFLGAAGGFISLIKAIPPPSSKNSASSQRSRSADEEEHSSHS